MNPALDGRALPLRPRINNKARGNLVAVQDQPMEHDGEIDIGDRPLAEQIFAAMTEQFRGAGTELARRDLRRRRKRRRDGAVEDGRGGAFQADRHQIAAQPCLDLTLSLIHI